MISDHLSLISRPSFYIERQHGEHCLRIILKDFDFGFDLKLLLF